MTARLTLEEVAYHRNGICGEGFHVVKFHDAENGPMLGVVFPSRKRQAPRVAVFQRDRLAAGTIAFGENSWRGDNYADWLRACVGLHAESWWADNVDLFATPDDAALWGRGISRLGRIVLEGRMPL